MFPNVYCHLVLTSLVVMNIKVLTILSLLSQCIDANQNLTVVEYHQYMYEEISKWISEYEWLRLGRDFCSCEDYKSKVFCEAMKDKSQMKCLEGPRGSKLLVKNYGSDAEIQAKYDPTPSRGISFIRCVVL